ncbi:MAG TPA: LysM peptidoglycan-binding domain-containing protein [Halanaerobiales bacterium]|nr:LysM peptidoglycan-binding domain-containing protein [Halanaerobiales bacterium]
MLKVKTCLMLPILFILLTTTTFARLPGKAFKENEHLLYRIKEGDTLSSLSVKFNNSLNDLMNLNSGISPENLRPGNVLKINYPSNLRIHTVKKGDTLWKISKQYNFPLQQIIKLNQLPDPDYLVPEELVIIPSEHKKTRSVLYFLKFIQNSAFLIPEERMIPVTHNLYTSVIEELIKGPVKTADTSIPLIPETRVLGIYVKDGIAHLNFSNEVRRASVGSMGEALLLNAIGNSLTEFREIKGVNILINGQSGDSIGGHIILNRPVQRNLSMVSYE